MTDNLANNSQGGAESASPTGIAPNLPTDETPEVSNTDTDDQLDADAPPAEETEEFEHDGKKYKLPKAIKPLLMTQSDYTRKTTELSEQRRALESAKTQHVQHNQDILKGLGRLYALDESLAEYQKVNWQELRQQNPTLADDHWFQYQQLKDRRGVLAQEVQQKEYERGLDQQRSRDKLVEEAKAVLARDIGFNSDLDGKLRLFSEKTLGLSPEDIFAISSEPKYVKAIHRAYLGEQAIKELAALKKAASNDAVKPIPTVGSSSGANARRTTDASGDKLSMEAWAKQEAARVKRR